MADEEFWSLYDEAADEVLKARHLTAQRALDAWFNLVDARLPPSPAFEQSPEKFERWVAAQDGRADDGEPLEWPTDPLELMALRLQLFRSGRRDVAFILNFGFDVAGYPETNFDLLYSGIAEDEFRPLKRDIKRFIQKAEADGTSPFTTGLNLPSKPVDLDDSNPTLIKLRIELDDLIKAMKAQNDMGDPMAFNQVLQEISAGRELLSGHRVNPALVGRVLDGALGWLVVNAPVVGLSIFASAIYDSLKLLFAH